jgi:hypothetical protein
VSRINTCILQDDGFGMLMSKLQKALAADAFENEEVVKYDSLHSFIMYLYR